MHLYKHFWKMLKNNKMGILIYLGIGAIMLLIIGIISSDIVNDKSQDEIKMPSVDISYLDNDNSVLSKGIIEYLSNDNEVTDYAGKTDEEINNVVYFSITDYHMEIPEGFQEAVESNIENMDLIEYRTGMSGSTETFAITSKVETFVNMYKHYIDEGLSSDAAVTKTAEKLSYKPDITVRRTNTGLGGTSKEWSIYEMSVYFIYLSLGMILMSAGAVIVNSNEENIGKRIETSPVTSFARLLADTIGLYSFGIVLWIIVMLAAFIYGHDTKFINERGYLLAINTLLMIFCNCSMTAFVSSFKMGQEALLKVANIIGLSMSFMSGLFVPQWLLGEGVLAVAKFVPFYWGVRAINTIYTESGAGLSFDLGEIYKCFGVSFVFIIAFALLALLVRRMRKA